MMVMTKKLAKAERERLESLREWMAFIEHLRGAETMNVRANEDLRAKAKAAGVRLWQIAPRMGMSEATLTRHLRFPMPEDERTAFLRAVEELAN